MPAAPERSCVGCRRKRAKGDLLRIVRTADRIRFDPQQRLPGRGAYLCPEPPCIEAATARDGQPVRRALRTASSDEVRTAIDQLLTATGGTAGAEPSEHRRSRNA